MRSGIRDGVNPNGTFEKAGALVSQLQAIAVKDAGHILSMDQAEQVDRIILDPGD